MAIRDVRVVPGDVGHDVGAGVGRDVQRDQLAALQLGNVLALVADIADHVIRLQVAVDELPPRFVDEGPGYREKCVVEL